MVHLLHFATVAALVSMMPWAHADILPPPGVKIVSYAVEVTSIPKADPQNRLSLAIFPWSNSNGAPRGDIKFVEPQTPVQFGRRIYGGSPMFWAVRADKAHELDAVRKVDDPFKSTDAIGEWLRKPGNAILCQFGGKSARISPHFHADSGEEQFMDKFVVKSLTADSCEMADASTLDAEIDDNLGSYTSNDAEPGHQQSKLNSWGSLAFSFTALAAICALVWRLSGVLRKTPGASLQVQE